MNYTKGEWKERLVGGERIIYVDAEVSTEIICGGIRHWNTPIVKAAPDMYEALKEAINALTIKLDKPKYQEILDFKSRVEPMILQALAKAEGK